ncbi:hypothetical protein BDP81DRAFT_134048 [Colletotrichum phormii]|uniref:Uncharacterized protein n=1 Tax=Colletotrichum phormii TaxID=359342 RepID=A0AAJ0A075_9PEZI|nr:uncharacterized protein BDP81DRAFT_134048 [Colletotrichum phormii]KAK1641472.1 hypothetical protein BDP81DRAFT_134048 [Colletotrichum phormii]
MGFLKTLGEKADKVALSITNTMADSRSYYSGGPDCVAAESVPRDSKGQRDPPPRISKMTWAETLEVEKAAKEKQADLVK